MKIVLTTHQFFPDYSAGTEVLTLEVAKVLNKKGHEVTVFTGHPTGVKLDDHDRFDYYVHDGIKVVRFKHDNVPMGGQRNIVEMAYNNRLAYTFFKDFIKRTQPDLVHFFHLSRISASIIDACEELNTPTFMTPTDFWLVCPTSQLRLPDNRPCEGPDNNSINCLRHLAEENLSHSPFTWVLRKLPDWVLIGIVKIIGSGISLDWRFSPWVRALVKRKTFLTSRMNKITKFVVPTNIMHTRLIQNGLKEDRTIKYPYGLNLSNIHNEVRQKTDNSLKIGYIGTIYEHKGVHVLIEALTKLQNKPLELKIYGETETFPDYYQMLREMVGNDSRIEFCGTFPNIKIGQVLSDLDVLVVPSIWYENTPLVIYSAQASGCPVIASDMPGLAEVLEHQVNGLLFPPGDSDALANVIDLLLTNQNLLTTLSENCRPPLSIENYTDKLLDIFGDTLLGKEGV
jgi:glycosyltransferase involved in cell wall biosynthesis